MQAVLVELQHLPGRRLVGRPLGHARQAVPLLARRPLLLRRPRRRRLVQRRIGGDPADQVDVPGQVLQDALAAVGAVAADDDLPPREQLREPADQLHGQLGAGAVVRVGRPLLPVLGLALALLALGQPLAVAVQPHAHRQGPDLRRRPGRVGHEQREDHPVVPPADVDPLAAGDQRVVVHPGAEDRQPALAAEGVVDAHLDRPLGAEGRDRLAGQRLEEVVDRPGGVAKKRWYRLWCPRWTAPADWISSVT